MTLIVRGMPPDRRWIVTIASFVKIRSASPPATRTRAAMYAEVSSIVNGDSEQRRPMRCFNCRSDG